MGNPNMLFAGQVQPTDQGPGGLPTPGAGPQEVPPASPTVGNPPDMPQRDMSWPPTPITHTVGPKAQELGARKMAQVLQGQKPVDYTTQPNGMLPFRGY